MCNFNVAQYFKRYESFVILLYIRLKSCIVPCYCIFKPVPDDEFLKKPKYVAPFGR